MPICTKCGTEVKDGAKFCGSCGAPSISSVGNSADAPVNQKPMAGKKTNVLGIIIGIAAIFVVVIIILAATVMPKFLEAKAKAKMDEAPRVLASFESALLTTLAEKGLGFTEADMAFTIPESKFFTYKIVKDPQGHPAACHAESKATIGKFSGTLVAEFVGEYNKMYRHSVEPADMREVAEKLIPEFFESDKYTGQDVVKISFTDSRDGTKYSTVKINGKTWMAENLNYKTGKSRCYNNKEANCQKYGRLYTWNTAKTDCPAGWHLPSDSEWDTLMVAVGGVKDKDEDGDIYWQTAGRKLKSKTGWDENGNGVDEFGFSALPGGIRDSDGDFYGADVAGIWWSATEYGTSNVWCRSMGYQSEGVNRLPNDKTDLFSVRCLRD